MAFAFRRLVARPLLAAAAVLGFGSSSYGQTYNWTSTTSGNWSTAGNWDVTPVTGPSAILNFSATGTSGYATVQDLGATTLNGIITNDTTTNGTALFLMPASPVGTLTFAQDPGTLANPFFNNNGTGPVFVAQPFTLAGTSFTFGGTGTGPVSFSGNSALSLAGATVTMAGNYRLILSNTGTAYPGQATGWNFNAGIVEVNAFLSLGTGATPLTFNGGTISFISGPSPTTGYTMTFNAGGGTINNISIDTATSWPTAGQLSGTGTLRKTGPGQQTFSAVNSGFSGGLTITGGTISIIDGAIGDSTATAPIAVSGTGTLNLQTSTSFASIANRPLSIGGFGVYDPTNIINGTLGKGALAASTASTTINLTNAITLTASASIRSSSATNVLELAGVIGEASAGFGLGFDGAGTIRLLSAATYTGATEIRQATLSLRDAGSIASPVVNVGGYSFGSNGIFLIDQSGINQDANRLTAATPVVNLRAGTFQLNGNAALPSSTAVPTLNLAAGAGAVVINGAVGGTTTLTVTNLTRGPNRGTLVVKAANLGTNGASGALLNVGNLAALPVGDFIGTGSATNLTDTKAPILRWAGLYTSSSVFSDFLTYGSTGLTALAAGQYSTIAAISGNLGDNVRLSAAGTVNSDAVVNSLMLGSTAGSFALTLATNSALRIESGAILQPATQVAIGPATTGQFSVLEFGSREAIFTGGSLNINSIISTTGGLTRGSSAAGNSILLAAVPNAITGPVALNSNGVNSTTGFINFYNENSLGVPTNPIILSGGSLTYLGPKVNWSRLFTVSEIGGSIALGSYNSGTNLDNLATGDAGQVMTLSNVQGTGQAGALLIKNGPGTLALTGNNSFSNAVRVTGGVLSVDSDAALGNSPGITLAGTQGRTGATTAPATVAVINTTLLFTNSMTTSKVVATNGLAGPGAGGGTLVNPTSVVSVSPGATVVLQGKVTGQFNLLKVGAGTLILEAENELTGGLAVSGGPTQLQDSVGGSLVLRGNGAVQTAAALRFNGGASFVLDNSTINSIDRVRKSAIISMNGGTLKLIGNASASSYQQFGTLSLVTQAVARVDIQPGAGNNAAFFVGSFSRTAAQATAVVFSGTGFGGNLGPNTSNVFFSTAPTLTGGTGGPGTTNRGIILGAIADTTFGGSGTGLVTYDARYGVRILDTATEFLNTTATATSTDNVRLTANETTAGAVSANSLTLAGGVTLDGGQSLTIGSGTLASLGASANTITNNLPFGAVGSYFFVNADLTINGNISNTGSTTNVARTGPGTLTVNGTASVAGRWTLDRGVTVGSTASMFGAIVTNASAAIVLDNGAILRNALFTAGVTMSDAAASRSVFVSSGGGTFDTNGINVTWDAGIIGGSNPGRFTKAGPGTLTYGPTSATFATNNLPAGLEVTGGTFIYGGQANSMFGGAPVRLTGANSTFAPIVALTIGSIAGDGTLDLGSGTNQLTIGNSTATLGTVTTTALGDTTSLLGTSGSFTPDTTFSGRITGSNTAGLLKDGFGTLTLTGTTSDYTGPTTINRGFIAVTQGVVAGQPGPLGSATSAILVGLSTAVSSDFAGFLTAAPVTIDRDVNLRNSTASSVAGLTVFGTTAVGTTVFAPTRSLLLGNVGSALAKVFSLRADAGGILDLQGVVNRNGSYSGQITLEKTGGGVLVFSNATSTLTNTRVVLAQGELTFNASSSSATTGPIGGATLVLNAGVLSAIGSQTIQNPVFVLGGGATFGGINTGSLTIAGAVSLGLADRILTVNAPLTVTGVVSGGVGTATYTLTKSGPGTMLLNNTNTFAGPTVVTAGTLGGTGSLAGSLTVNSAGTVAPGDVAIGTFTVGGSATITGTLQAKIGASGASDLLNVTGPVTIASGSTLNVTGPADGSTYTLIQGSSISGTFSNLTLPPNYSISYGATQVQIFAVVPEPALVGLAGLAVLGLRRRVRRAC